MPQSLARDVVHLIFATKHRQTFLEAEVIPRKVECVGGIPGECQSPAIEIGCMADRSHLLFCLSKWD
jgi:hypothetical protein